MSKIKQSARAYRHYLNGQTYHRFKSETEHRLLTDIDYFSDSDREPEQYWQKENNTGRVWSFA
jgi:hypothetical protein